MRNVVIGFLGTQLDMGKKRKWKPTVSLTTHDHFPVDRIEILHDIRHNRLAHHVKQEIETASPDTEVLLQRLDLEDPWDFQEVYGKLYDFAQNYGFDEDREQYHVHLTTGTHVAQICWFLLTESRHIPARLLQTGPPRENSPATMDIIDLDLSRYNALQQRFDETARAFSEMLKGGIDTHSAAYNHVVEQIETVASNSDAPILLQGETGTGKSEMAQRIYELKLQRRRVKGRLVQINCATLRGDDALATLFGQRRSHTGVAGSERSGLLREADGGVLFLDEIDELGRKEQAVLLSAIETGRYYPLGSDHEVTSRFQIVVSANRDLSGMVADGHFRPDLLARIGLWRFDLPPLRERREDMQAYLFHELARFEQRAGQQVGFNADALEAYLRFARDPGTQWPANFRDLRGSIERLCTLAPRGRITRAMVDEETQRMADAWRGTETDDDARLLASVLGAKADEIDPFDAVQLALVVRVCRSSATLSDAGRKLFANSRQRRQSRNDADRLRKYLAKFGLDWARLVETAQA